MWCHPGGSTIVYPTARRGGGAGSSATMASGSAGRVNGSPASAESPAEYEGTRAQRGQRGEVHQEIRLRRGQPAVGGRALLDIVPEVAEPGDVRYPPYRPVGAADRPAAAQQAGERGA